MEAVASAPGHRINDATRCAAILGQRIGGDYLKFLHGVLGNIRSTRPAGVLIVELVGGVVAVGEKCIAAGIASE